MVGVSRRRPHVTLGTSRSRWLAPCPHQACVAGLPRSLPMFPIVLVRPRQAVIVLALLVAACTGDGNGASASAKTTAQSGATGAAQRDSARDVVIAPAAVPYKAAPVSNAGSITGTVTLSTPLAPLAMAAAGKDSAVCGRTIADLSAPQVGNGLGGAVVWLDGVRSGKPIPLERRLELESMHCNLIPRVQAGVVGSAVNVIGHDPLRQHLQFTGASDPKLRAEILLGRDEQVIPTELPAKSPGLVLVKDTDHPWPRAVIAVFDHPYFAVTKPDGSFSIDGVAPGTYTLVVWHERTKKVTQRVVVGPGAGSKVEIKLVP